MKRTLLTILAFSLMTATAWADVVYSGGAIVTSGGEPVVVCENEAVTLAGGVTDNAKVIGSNIHVTANSTIINVTHAFCPCLVDNAVTVTATNFASWNPSGSNMTFTGTGTMNATTSAFSGAKPAGFGTDTNNRFSISTDPFVSANTLDFHLKRGSPLVNTGTASVGYETDLDGETRPKGAGWDMGAYEWMGTTGRGVGRGGMGMQPH